MGITLKQLTDTVSLIKDYVLHKTHKIDQISYAQKTVNTELDYCYCTQGPTEVSYQNDGSMTGKIKYVTPTSYNTNMEYNTEENYVLLKAGKKYFISATIRFTGTGITNTSQCLVGYNVVNKDTGLVITAQGVDQTVILSPTSGTECIGCATPNEDIKVMLGITWLSGKITAIPSATMVIQEIGREVTIDPVEYVNQHDGIEDTPVGHIISHMGTIPPKHYLICDGAEYNILDYPYLAQHIEDNFGSINFFGGDGTNTFCVPDLRGEFLRGSGINAHENQGSGDEVGKHQDATEQLNMQFGSVSELWVDAPVNSLPDSTKQDSKIGFSATERSYYQRTNKDSLINTVFQPFGTYYTSRPTNTSVLYCIKYEPTYYMVRNNTNYLSPTLYSEEERIIGSWIDGKPLYEKTFTGYKVPTTNTDGVLGTESIDVTNLNIERYVLGNVIVYNDTSQFNVPIHYGETTYGIFMYYNIISNNITIQNTSKEYSNRDVTFTIQYTKTTDAENSFTDDMIKDYIVQTGEIKSYSDEEVINAVNDLW